MVDSFCNNTNCLLSVKVSAGEEWYVQIRISEEDLMKELVIKVWADNRAYTIMDSGDLEGTKMGGHCLP